MTRFGRVSATRGSSCFEVAQVLGDDGVTRVDRDVVRYCVTHRIDLLVVRRLSNFDLVPSVAPYGVDLEAVSSVTAAVGDGPHSPLATAVAARMAAGLGIPGVVATVYRSEEEVEAADQRLERLGAAHPELERHAVQRPSAAKLIETLTPETLLVVGAPGGSWFQRQIYGVGHRLQVKAPGGALLVRDAPRRSFHEVVDAEGTALGPRLRVGDARQVMTHSSAPVADEGRLVGVIRAAAIAEVDPDVLVGDLMEDPVSVGISEEASAAGELVEFLDGGPVPVVDGGGRLVGVIPPAS